MSANDNQMQLEVLQPDISGEILKATSEELKGWIKDGRLKPFHQIRIKNLAWVEARKIPAFKALFEAENELETESNPFKNEFLYIPPAPRTFKSEINNAKDPTAKQDSAGNDAAEKKVETSTASKRRENKNPYKSNANGSDKPKTNIHNSKTKNLVSKARKSTATVTSSKRNSSAKSLLIYLAGTVLIFLISLGGAYVWNYQLKSPAEFDEKSLPEVLSLTDKLTADKLDLRLKAARENDQTDLNPKVAALEKQYEAQRQTIVQNHRLKLQDVDFYPTFYFSFAVLMAFFLLFRIFFGKTPQAEIGHSSKNSLSEFSAVSNTSSAKVNEIETKDFINHEDGEKTAAGNSKIRKSTAKSAGDEIGTEDDLLISESEKSLNCVLHKGRVPVFVCEACDNNFCKECIKTFGDVEKCCPFCKIACQSLEAENAQPPKASAKKKEIKPVNLLELNKGNSDFIVYDFEEERSPVVGVIQAFVIALFFSAAISILWAYKISPYFEHKETVQTATENSNSAKIPLGADPKTYNKEIDEALKTGPCIDPETQQPFECDEETRRALYEHTRKTQSVEKAKQDVLNTSKLITDSPGENAEKTSESPELIAAKNEKSQKEKKNLIVSFSISFVLIFGTLLATVFLSKDKKTFLDQNQSEIAKAKDEEFEIDLDSESDFEIEVDEKSFENE